MLFALLYSRALSKYQPEDPLYNKQFIVNNVGVYGSAQGSDINVKPVWEEGVFGTGVTVGIVGNGCNINHADLSSHNIEDMNINFDAEHNDKDVIPYKQAENRHKTTGLAGITLASSNDVAITGVAPNASFYCIRQTFSKDSNRIASAISYENLRTDVKLLSYPRSCSDMHSSFFSSCPPPTHDSTIEESFSKNINKEPIYVSPVGDDGISGADANFFPEVKNPKVISIADTTPSGARAFWSNRGNCIVANAPAGGSFSILDKDSLNPTPVTLNSDENNGAFSSFERGFEPSGAGAAAVAGVVALMFEKNPKLTYRDVQAILAMTSSKNDPHHFSWTTNKAGFAYSPVYGFGRVNAELAVKTAGTWTTLSAQTSGTGKFEDVSLYTTRGGFQERSCNLNAGNIRLIEYVELEFKYDSVSTLRVDLVSPMGTRAHVVVPSNVDDTNETLHYVVRDFFGESSEKGDWRVFVSRDGFGNQSTVTDIKITVHGLAEKNNNIRRSGLVLDRVMRPLPTSASVRIQTNLNASVKCEQKFNLRVAADGDFARYTYDVYIRDDDFDTLFLLREEAPANVDVELFFPCYLMNRSVYLYAENREHVVASEVAVNITNQETDLQLLAPTPYERLTIDSTNTVTVPLDFSTQLQFLASDPEAQAVIVGVWDLERKESLYSMPLLIRESSKFSFALDHNVSKAVVYVIPNWMTNYNGCTTIIQPVSILNQDDENVPRFNVPLSKNCPAPPGVQTEQESNPGINTDDKVKIGYIVGIVLFVVAIAIAILIWNLKCRKKSHPATTDLIDDGLIA